MELQYFADTQRHLVCFPYSIANLHIMAEDLAIRRCWFHKNHYDVPKTRIREVAAKCHSASPKQIVKIMRGEAPPSV